MQITHGGEEAITEITVKEALEYIQDRIKGAERQTLLEVIKSKEVVQQAAESLKTAEIERNSRIKARSESWAHISVKYLRFMAIGLVFLTMLSTFPWGFPSLESEGVRYGLFVLQFLLLIFSVVDLVHGTPIDTFIRRFEVHLTSRIESLLHSLAN